MRGWKPPSELWTFPPRSPQHDIGGCVCVCRCVCVLVLALALSTDKRSSIHHVCVSVGGRERQRWKGARHSFVHHLCLLPAITTTTTEHTRTHTHTCRWYIERAEVQEGSLRRWQRLLHPSVYVLACAYKTLDKEEEERRKAAGARARLSRTVKRVAQGWVEMLKL